MLILTFNPLGELKELKNNLSEINTGDKKKNYFLDSSYKQDQ